MKAIKLTMRQIKALKEDSKRLIEALNEYNVDSIIDSIKIVSIIGDLETVVNDPEFEE